MAEQKAVQLVSLVVVVEVRGETRHMGENCLQKLAGPPGTGSRGERREWMVSGRKEVDKGLTRRGETHESPKTCWPHIRPGTIGWPGKGDSDFHCISFYFAHPRALGFPVFRVARSPQSPTLEIRPLCSVIPSEKGGGDIPKLLCMFPTLMPGGMPDLSRQDQAGCPAACPSSAHQVVLPPDLRKNPLSEEKKASLLGVGICVQSPIILSTPCLLQCEAPHLPLSCTREEEGPQIAPSFLHSTVLYPEPSKAIH